MASKIHIICGARSAIAQCLIKTLSLEPDVKNFAFSRGTPPSKLNQVISLEWVSINYNEAEIAEACRQLKASIDADACTVHSITIFHGTLHSDTYQPERALKQLTRNNLSAIFEANTFVPINWIQQLLPILDRKARATITVFSARIGSISDNRLGGWHSYRASKAALNMLLKTTAIEIARSHPKTKLIAFHPGTTKTPLSEPFTKSLPNEKLFSPEFAASQLLSVIEHSKADGELSYLDWKNEAIGW